MGPRDRRVIGEFSTESRGSTYAVALCCFDGQEILAVGCGESIILLDSHSGDQVGRPLTDEGRFVLAAPEPAPPGRWQSGTTYLGHIEENMNTVDALAVGHLDDGDVLASASSDKTVRLWKPEAGQVVGT